MNDSGYGSPGFLNENVVNNAGERKIKLVHSNSGAMSKFLAPVEIVAKPNETLAAAIKSSDPTLAVERRLFWAEVEGHDGEVAVNPFSLLCRWLKPGKYVRMEQNENVKYNTKKFAVAELSEQPTNLFFVKTDDRRQLTSITDILFALFKGKDICVAAIEGETLEEAIVTDGRFKNVFWFELHHGPDRATPSCMSYKASSYHNTIFSVVVKKSAKKNLDSSSEGTAENSRKTVKRDEEEEEESEENPEEVFTGAFMFSEHPRILSRKKMREEMHDSIHRNARSILVCPDKRNEYQKEIPKIAREQFANHANVARPAKLSKHVAAIYPSVGQISCGSYQASCFLVDEDMIITNYHVRKDLLDIQRDASDRAAHESIFVDFEFDSVGQTNRSGSLEVANLDDERNIYDEAIDYAFLALKSKAEGKTPLGERVKEHVPRVGLLAIIGHPEGREKLDDTCVIIPEATRSDEISKRVEEKQKRCLKKPWECSYQVQQQKMFKTDDNPIKCIHLYNPAMNVADKNDDIISYDTSTMFHGSSGSPVINMSGEIVAIHSCGYSLHENKKKTSLFEYAFTFEAIISDLLQKGLSEKVKSFFPKWTKINVS